MTTICECCGQPIRARKSAPKAPTFKAWADWMPAHRAAKLAACNLHGDRWSIQPGAYVHARLPAAWVACKVFGRVSKTPRDVRLPAAQFWPNGMLPAGPEYAAPASARVTADIVVTDCYGNRVSLHPMELPAFLNRNEIMARQIADALANDATPLAVAA
jgi:hypothetical protein